MMQILLFLLGIHLAMQLIAACYGLVDLWYCIDRHLLRVLTRILFWGATVALLDFWLTVGYQTWFQAGILFFAVFHVVIYWFGQLLRALLEKSS